MGVLHADGGCLDVSASLTLTSVNHTRAHNLVHARTFASTHAAHISPIMRHVTVLPAGALRNWGRKPDATKQLRRELLQMEEEVRGE